MRHILLTGPHSCGKTTLANALVKRWSEVFPEETQEPVLITEVARNVMSEQGFTREDVPKVSMEPSQVADTSILTQTCVQLAFQEAILEGQLQEENRVGKTCISDRCLIDPIVYTRLLNSENRESNYRLLLDRPDVCQRLEHYRDTSRTLIILFEPVEEFAFDDGIRRAVENMDEWMECFACFQRVLRDATLDWKTLGPEIKDLDERVHKVIGWANSS